MATDVNATIEDDDRDLEDDDWIKKAVELEDSDPFEEDPPNVVYMYIEAYTHNIQVGLYTFTKSTAIVFAYFTLDLTIPT